MAIGDSGLDLVAALVTLAVLVLFIVHVHVHVHRALLLHHLTAA